MISFMDQDLNSRGIFLSYSVLQKLLNNEDGINRESFRIFAKFSLYSRRFVVTHGVPKIRGSNCKATLATWIRGTSCRPEGFSESGVRLVPRDAWAGRAGLRAAADLNAVPPLSIEGIEVTDDGAERDGVTVFGALGVGGLKMKIHKACIARLFERNDLVLDVETIAEVGQELVK